MIDTLKGLRLAGIAVIAAVVAPEVLSSPPPPNVTAALAAGLQAVAMAVLVAFTVAFWFATGERSNGPRRALLLLAIQTLCALATSAELLLVIAAELPLLFGSARARLLFVALALVMTALYAFTAAVVAYADLPVPADAPPIALEAVAMLAWACFAYACGAIAAEQRQQRDRILALNTELAAASAELADRSRLVERLAISRELHDSAGHTLTALIVQLEVARKLLEEGRPRLAVERAVGLARSTLEQVRGSVDTLRQPRLADLVEGLEELSRTALGIEVVLSLASPLPPLAPARAHALYRCAQEGITNAVRHSGARRIVISAQALDGGVALQLSDDGVGRDAFVPGNGLTGLRERIESLEGTLVIETAAGRGFRIAAWVPASATEIDA